MIPELEGFVLVGGHSRRMGRDKSRLQLGGRTFAEIIARTLSSLTSHVTLIGGAAEETDAQDHLLLWPRIADTYSDCGPLGGIHAALTICREPWAAIIACDLPFVTTQALTSLAAHRGNYDAVVPLQRGGEGDDQGPPARRPQPLCALYAREPCLEAVTKLIAAGERRTRLLLKRVRTKSVKEESLGGPQHLLLNVNTLAEYEAALRLAAEE